MWSVFVNILCVFEKNIYSVVVGYSILCVTRSKLALLAARQASKLGDEVFRQGITTLFRKPADREDGGLVVQKTVLLGSGCQFLL